MGEGGQPGQDPAVAGDPVVPDDAPLLDDASLPDDAQLPEDAVVPAHFDDAEQAARAIAPRRNVWIW